MLISVIDQQGDCRLERDEFLESLIYSGEIQQFLRLDGWVIIGCDPIRIIDEKPQGIERRQRYSIFSRRNPLVRMNLTA